MVSLPGAGAFAAVDDGVVIEDAEGSLRLVEEDGDVSDWDEAMPDVRGADLPSPYGARLGLFTAARRGSGPERGRSCT